MTLTVNIGLCNLLVHFIQPKSGTPGKKMENNNSAAIVDYILDIFQAKVCLHVRARVCAYVCV